MEEQEKKVDGGLNTNAKGNTTNKVNGDLIAFIVGIVICVILLPIFVINMVLIIDGATSNDPPSVFGRTPLVVLTDSMQKPTELFDIKNSRPSGQKDENGEDIYKLSNFDHLLEGYEFIDSGDLIFVEDIDVNQLELYDVITFKEGTEENYVVVTHMIIDIDEPTEENGDRIFKTMGVNNSGFDSGYVEAGNVIGIYDGDRIGKIGHFILWLQKPLGMAICIGIPVILFVAYMFYTTKKDQLLKATAKDQELNELEAELIRLREMQRKANAEQKYSDIANGKDESKLAELTNQENKNTEDK